MSSTEFRSYGERGPGKWIIVYAREGHTFAVIAGVRLDTTPYDHYTGKWGLPRGKPFIGRRAVLMQDIPSGCSGGNETDKSHSKALRAKCARDAGFISRKLWECARVSASLCPHI